MATVRIQLRRGTSSQWDNANPTLAAGEIGIETDTNTFKFGDGVTAWNSLDYALSDTVDDYIPLSEKGVALGVATLDASGFVPSAQLPPLAKVTVSAVANQAARLALTVEPGDIAIQSDNGTTYVLQSSPASTDANWKEISATAAISAAVSAHESDTTNVHGISDTSILVTTTGTQTLTNKTITSPTGLVKADVGLSNVDNTSDADKPVSTAQAAADAAVASNAATALSNHESDTTNIHGIVDTSLLVTTTGAQTLTSKSLTSPELTGTPTAPTATVGTDTTQIATTAFVQDAIELVVGAAPAALNTLSEIATSLNNDADLAGTLTSSISTKVSKSGDTMSGVLNMGSNKITDVALATSNNDAANKYYVDGRTAADIATHNSLTTNVHGIGNVADLVLTSDARLNNERTPGDNSVTTAKIVDGAVTLSKIADSSVDHAKLANSSVTTAKIADVNVTTAKIADSSVTAAKIADDAVTTAKILDANVTTAKILDSSVTTAKIADNALTTAKILDSSVTTAKIADTNVTTDKIADDAVTTIKIANGNVTTAKIQDANITAAKIADDAITTIKIANGNVTTEKINDAAVTTDKINSLAITEGKIADGAITSAKIANGTIVDADINNSAAIAQSKVADLTSDLALKAPLASPTFTGTVSGITATMVGLGNVDNTSDANKPVSTATQTALDLKANLASPTFTGTVTLPSTTSIGTVTNTEIGYLDGVTSSVQTQIDAKAASADVSAHTSATTSVHGISDTAQLAYKNAANQTFTGNLEVDGNMTVDGNLTVNGTTFNASATTITIEDNLVQLAHQNAANTVDLGVVVAYNDGTAKHAGIVRDVSANKWKLFEGVTDEPSTTVNFAQGTLDDLEVADITASSATIGNVSNTELQYLDGVTSGIQTQIDSKLASATAASTYAPLSSPTFTGTVTVAASGVAFTDGTQTKAGVPSLTTIGSTIGAAYNLSTGGLSLRDQLIPISGAFAVTVPANSTTAYPVGTSISFYQSSGTGGNFVAAAGVTILNTPGLKLRTTSSSATLTKVATDTWLLAGDLSA